MYDCTVVLFEAFCRSQNTAYGAYRAAPTYAVGKDVVQPVRLHVTFAESLSLERTWKRDRNYGDVLGKVDVSYCSRPQLQETSVKECLW